MPSPDITETLCTACGLCCDGSIFADVELKNEAEEAGLEALGLAIDTDGPPLLLQPCTALDGTRCTVYASRPGCCRTFECRLLQKTKRAEVAVDRALALIAETRGHSERLDALCRAAGEVSEDLPLKERCIEVLAEPCEGDDDAAHQRRGDIAAAMDLMGRLLHEHFVGD